jgi:hypothetical protein
MKLKNLSGGEIVGVGTDFIVILKDKKRILLHLKSYDLVELKNSTTPYGSEI